MTNTETDAISGVQYPPIIVTGGSGFIGTHLVQQLVQRGESVVNLDIAKPRLPDHTPHWVELDLLDRAALIATVSRIRPRQIIHLAARTDLDEEASLDDYAINTRGVTNLIDAAEAAGSVQQLAITSSMLVCKVGHSPTADNDYSATTVYGESKVLTETLTRERDPSCTWMLLRPTTIWGAYHTGLRDGFFRSVQKGYYLHPGRKPFLKSYGYVENIVHQILGLMTASPEHIHRKTFYLSDQPIDLHEWVNSFSVALTGRSAKIAPLWLMKLAALVGDAAQRLTHRNMPITSFRLKNMTTQNVINVKPTITLKELALILWRKV